MRFSRTEFWRRVVKLLFLCLLLVLAGHAKNIYTAEPSLSKLQTEIKPFDPKNVPEGLYLINPLGNSISPLVIAQKGKLVDPYLLVHQSGIAALQEPVVRNKAFSVYINGQKLGMLKDVRLKVFAPALQGLIGDIIDPDGGDHAIYEGRPVPREDRRTRPPRFPFTERGLIRSVYTPETYNPSPPAMKEQGGGVLKTVTDADLDKIEKAARAQFVPRYLTILKQRLGEKYGGESEALERKSHIASAYVLDINSVGQKDIVGVYWVTAVDDMNRALSHSVNVAYIFRSDGKLDVISSTEESHSKLKREDFPKIINVLGALDFDGDGVLELVLGTLTSTGETYIYRRVMEIYRKQGPEQEWYSIYATSNNVQFTF